MTNSAGAQLAVPAQSETLPILPAVADAGQQVVATDPFVLHLIRTSDQRTPEPSSLDAWRVLSSISTYQALQKR